METPRSCRRMNDCAWLMMERIWTDAFWAAIGFGVRAHILNLRASSIGRRVGSGVSDRISCNICIT